jgi:tetratricopeptide (TPR) repeat protein
MRFVPGLALSLFLGAAAASLLAPAAAQPPAAPQPPHLAREERIAIAALQDALARRDYASAASALTAAQAAARGDDARYYTALLQFQLARETSNAALQASAAEALIASGRMPQSEVGRLYGLQGTGAYFGRDRDRAEAAYARAIDLSPSPETALALAQVKIERRKSGDAVALVDRAIELQKARGQIVPESWYRRGVELALSSSSAPQALKLSREWIAAYPSSENWRDAMLIYRDIDKPDPAALVDAIRLQRLARGFGGERDYMDAASGFTAAGLPGESRSVLDEGVTAKMVDPAKPAFKAAILAATRGATAGRAKLAALRRAGTLEAGDQLLSFGDYAAAADAYAAALQKGGADANLVNTRLGIALALAGRRPEAQAAFGAVAGARADLASLWLVWLAQRG